MPLVGLVLEQRRCCAAAALPGSAPGRPRRRSRSVRRYGGQSRGSRTSSTPLALPYKMSTQVRAQRRRQRSEDVGVRSVRHRRTSDLDHILTDCAQVPAYASLRISQKTGLVETSTKPYLCAVGSAGITRLHHSPRISRVTTAAGTGARCSSSYLETTS